jgi:hypothetical protein
MNPNNGLIFGSAFCSWVITDTSFFVNHNSKFQIKINNIDKIIIDRNYFKLPNLPTSDPHSVGALWNNSGVLNISSG